MTPPALAVRGLRKRFGDRRAVEDLDLEVRRGEAFAILGPNGAGKTTTFHLLVGLLGADAGEIERDGQPVDPTDPAGRRRLGVVFQQPSVDDKLTGRENLRLGASLYGITGAEAERRVDAALALVELADRADEPVARYSGGMKRRIEIARVLLTEPELLVMDEPSRGVDVGSQRRIWAWLDEARRERGLTVVLSTHSPEEAERCDRVAVLDQGRLIALGTPEELRARVGGDVIRIAADEPEAVARALPALGVQGTVVADEILVTSAEAHRLVPRIVEAFPPGRLRSVSLRRPDLADVFVTLTGRPLEEREEPAPAPRRKRTPSLPRAHRAGAAPKAGPSALALLWSTFAVLLRRDLVRFFRQKSRVVGALGQPVIFWLVIGGGLAGSFRMPGSDVGYLEYFYPGVVVMIVLFTSIFTTLSVIEDRHAGFLQAVLVAPAPRSALVLGKVSGGVAVALVQAALFLLLAPWAGVSTASLDVPLAAAVLVGTSLAFTALGFLLAWWLDSVQGYHAIMSVLLIPLWVLSGAMFPAQGAGVLGAAMRWNPMSYAVDGMRRALHGPGAGLPGASPAIDLAVVLGFMALTLLGAVTVCRRRA